MVFDARVATKAAEAKYPPHPFIGLDGEQYSFPHPMLLPADDSKRITEAAGEEQATIIMDVMAAAAPEAWEALGRMSPAVQMELLREWFDRLGDEGKEPSTSLPETGPATRSKRTSPSGAKTSGRSRSGKSQAASGSS